METTSQNSDHKHVSKMLKDELRTSEDGKKVYWVTTLYGCTKCDATSPTGWDYEEEEIDHTKCGGPDICFGCKVQTLQLSPGDAAGNKAMSQKKWDAELNAYSAARKQGIQPAGTSMKAVQDAVDKSNKVGKAYDANTGGFKG